MIGGGCSRGGVWWFFFFFFFCDCMIVRLCSSFVPPSSLPIGVLSDCFFGNSYTFIVAFNDMNNDPNILPNTTLKMIFQEGGENQVADPTKTLLRTLKMCEEDKIIAVIGARYDDDSKQIAYLSSGFKVPQISYCTADPEFSVKSEFPYFSRTYPDISKEIDQMIAVLLYQNWKKVSILYTADSQGSAMFALFGNKIKTKGIRILTSVIINDPSSTEQDLIPYINVIKQSGARIIVDLTNYYSMRVNLMRASKTLGLRVPPYQWIGHHGSTNLPDIRFTNGSVKYDDLVDVLEGMMVIQPIVPLWRPQFQQLIAKINALPETPNVTAMHGCVYAKSRTTAPGNLIFQGTVYDAVKLLALALHEMIYIRQLDPTLLDNRDELNTLIRQQRFSGVTGDIQFDASGDVLLPFGVYQVPRADRNYSTNIYRGIFVYNRSYWEYNPTSAFVWKDNIIPYDTIIRDIYQNSADIRNMMIAITVVLISALLCIHGILYYYRQTPVLKATSYIFTQLSVLGAIFITTSVFIRMFIVTLQQHHTINHELPILDDVGHIVNLDVSWQSHAKDNIYLEMWFINLGYYLLIGALLVKTFRISKIFSISKLGPLNRSTDYHLLIGLVAVLLLETCVLIGVMLGDPVDFTLQEYNSTTDIFVYETAQNVTFPMIYLFRFLILVPTMIYTFFTRNIPSAFNESIQLTGAVYNCAFTSMLLPVLESILTQTTDTSLIIHGVIVWFIALSTCAIVVTPKLNTIYTNPHQTSAQYIMAQHSALKSNKHARTANPQLQQQPQPQQQQQHEKHEKHSKHEQQGFPSSKRSSISNATSNPTHSPILHGPRSSITTMRMDGSNSSSNSSPMPILRPIHPHPHSNNNSESSTHEHEHIDTSTGIKFWSDETNIHINTNTNTTTTTTTQQQQQVNHDMDSGEQGGGSSTSMDQVHVWLNEGQHHIITSQ